MMSAFLHDLRYGFRMLAKNAGFSFTAVVTLALTIGISTAVFSVIDAVLIRPLPYDHPERIVSLHTWSQQGYTQPASYPEYRDWRRENRVFSALAANSFGSANFEDPSGAIALPKVETTDNFFDVFGVSPILGRTFAAGEDQPGKNDVVVLSYEIWQQDFGSQPGAVGQTIKIDGRPYTVIGVMPAGFRYPISARNAIYTPLHMSKQVREGRGEHWLPTVARMKPGISRQQAQSDMDGVLEGVGRAYPNESKGRRVELWSLASSMNANARQPLKVLVFAVLALLAIGCVNVAGLLTVRGVKREREIALRSALGASRLRIVRQILSETLLLGLLGSIVGTALAHGLLKAIRTLLIAAMARGADVHIDKAALLVALVLSVATSLFAGLTPALRLCAIAPNLALKTGGGAGSSRGQHRLRAAFIVTQVALALVLLVTSGLLLRVLAGLRSTDLGFDAERVMATEIDLSAGTYQGHDVVASFYHPLLERVAAIPGVKSAGLIQVLPIQNYGWNSDTHIVGHPPDPPNQERLAEVRTVTPGYFNALGISLVRGRMLDERIDTLASPPVVVVNEAFVEKFFSNGEDPLGKYIDRDEKPMIVGVVRSIRQDLYEPPLAEMDFLIDQVPAADRAQYLASMQLVVRTGVESGSVIPSLRRVFHDLDRGLPFRPPLTMHQVVADVLVLERLENWLFGTFAGLAVLLAIVGLCGLISHEVELSTRDIGVRMALGASRCRVLGAVYRRVILMLTLGVAAGLLTTVVIEKLLAAVIEIHAGKDALVISSLAAAFLGVGLVSVVMPARRATKVEPMEALRYE